MLIKNSLTDKICMISCCCILILVGLRYFECFSEYMILNDEFGYWGIAASLAGYDWRDLISITPYYGFGYPCLLYILYKMGIEISVLYKAAIIINVFMWIVAYNISIYCGKKLFSKLNTKIIIWGNLIVFLYPNTLFQTQVAWSETFLYLLFWMITALLISINEKVTTLKLLSITILTGIMFMTHQRTLGIVISVFVILLILVWNKNIKMRQVLLVAGAGVALLLFYKFFKDWIQTSFWLKSSVGKQNDFSHTATNVVSGLSLNGAMNLVEGFFGKAFYFLISGGIFFFVAIWEMVKKIFDDICNIKKTGKRLQSESNIYIFLVLSFFSTIGITLLFMINNYARLDVVVYGRYIENTIGPFLMIGILFALSRNITYFKVLCYTGLVVISGIATCNYLSKVQGTSFVDVCSVGASSFFTQYEKYTAVCVMAITGIVIAMVFCLIKKSKKMVCIVLFFVIFAGNWLSSANAVTKKIVVDGQRFRKKDNYEVAQKLIEAGVKDVYYICDVDVYAVEVKYLQYWMPEIKINVVQNDQYKKIPKNSIWIYENISEKTRKFRKDAVIYENPGYTIATQKGSVWEDTIISLKRE